jgi:transposase-like protein
MNAYSEDLRKKIVKAKESGMPTVEVARTFGVGISSVKRYAKTAREGGSLRPKKSPGRAAQGRRARKAALGSGPQGAPGRHPLREARVSAQRGRAEGERGPRLQALEAYGMEQKKRSVGASARDEFLRSAWRALVAGHIDARRLVFVDEMGSNTSLAPLYAWSRRGERALAKIPRNWGSNLTLLWRA